MQRIPFNSDPCQAFRTVLNGTALDFEARYNDRTGLWTFDILKDGVTLVQNVALTIGSDLIAQHALDLGGGIVVFDLSHRMVDAGPDDLGDRVVVMWMNNADLAVMRKAGLNL